MDLVGETGKIKTIRRGPHHYPMNFCREGRNGCGRGGRMTMRNPDALFFVHFPLLILPLRDPWGLGVHTMVGLAGLDIDEDEQKLDDSEKSIAMQLGAKSLDLVAIHPTQNESTLIISSPLTLSPWSEPFPPRLTLEKYEIDHLSSPPHAGTGLLIYSCCSPLYPLLTHICPTFVMSPFNLVRSQMSTISTLSLSSPVQKQYSRQVRDKLKTIKE
eukprot:1366101-Amorphochlora_amoeboformis.AAC.3